MIIRRPDAFPLRSNPDYAEVGEAWMETFPTTLDDLEALFAAIELAAEGGANTTLFGFNGATANADPTAGKIAFDNATQTSSTTIRFNLTDGAENDATAWLATLDRKSVV